MERILTENCKHKQLENAQKKLDQLNTRLNEIYSTTTVFTRGSFLNEEIAKINAEARNLNNGIILLKHEIKESPVCDVPHEKTEFEKEIEPLGGFIIEPES